MGRYINHRSPKVMVKACSRSSQTRQHIADQYTYWYKVWTTTSTSTKLVLRTNGTARYIYAQKMVLRLSNKVHTQWPASSRTCICTPAPSSEATSSAAWILCKSSSAHLCKLLSAFKKFIWTPLGTFSTISLSMQNNLILN